MKSILTEKFPFLMKFHKIEDQIIQFIGFDIYGSQVSECNLNFEKYDFKDLESMIQLTDDIAFSYAKKIKDIKESPIFESNPDYDLISKLERQYDRFRTSKN